MIKKIVFKKIVFSNLSTYNFKNIVYQKKLFIFPSGSGIPLINKNKNYYSALKNADYVFFDSGFFVLLLRIFKNIKVKKFSGFKFLYFFFKYLKKNKKKSIYCIEPNLEVSKSNKKFFKRIGVKKVYSYLAPDYNSNNLKDKKLIKEINKFNPDFILTNIGGGTQEILGLFLKQNLKKKKTIFCTGGAISFFTGEQAPINLFVDKFYLGWLLRLIYNPIVFYKRYLYALRLVPMVLFNKIKLING
jgi:UDP-N-acetyl-D-mannosaminuronic acid transferase (WecB/TagA/CpsF family)